MSRVAPKHRAPKPEPLAQPDGCFRCGIGGLLGWYDERWWCARHFFKEPGKRWPKPGGEAVFVRGTEEITLDSPRIENGISVGKGRQKNNLKKGFKDKHGGSGEQIHIDGALAEEAVSMSLNIPSIGVLSNPDVGGDVGQLGVRSTNYKNGHLILHDDDADAREFALVVSHDQSRHTIVGTILGRMGKLKKYWRNDVRAPAYFVPQHVLTPWIKYKETHERTGDDERATAS